jgi:hypothetical protein
MAKDDNKKAGNGEGAGTGAGASMDVTASNPSTINAPERTGGVMDSSTTTAAREPKLDSKPLGSQPPSSRAEEEVNAAVEAAMHEEYVQTEAQRRVAAARAQRLMDSVNTENPYGLAEGQKPVYQVGAWLVDPDGNRVQKVSDLRPPSEVIVDPATSMKQM